MNPICTQQQDWNLQLEHHEYNLYTATGVRSTATSGIQSVRINRAEIYSYSIRNPTCTHQQGWNLQLGHHESSLYISTGVKSTARVSWIQSVHINRSEIYSQCVMNPICDIHPCFTFGWSWFWKTNIEVWTEWNKCIHTIQYYTVRLVFRVVQLLNYQQIPLPCLRNKTKARQKINENNREKSKSRKVNRNSAGLCTNE